MERTSKMICIAGKNDIAVNALKHLITIHPKEDVCFLPNPSDKGVDGWQPSFRAHARAMGVGEAGVEDLYNKQNLIFISLEYSELIDTDRFASKNLFNIHFSLLPSYKGMYTSALPILNGETQSGVTLHRIDHGIDTGDIIDQMAFDISTNDTARDLYFKYLQHGLSLFKKNIQRLISGEFVSTPQSSLNASYFSKKAIDYQNLKVNFHKTACEVRNQYRAFTFREFQMPHFESSEIHQAEITNIRSTMPPGTLLDENDDSYTVATIDYNIKLYKDHYRQLWRSCETGDIQSFDVAAAKVSDINFMSPQGWNAIIIATYHGHVNMVKKLLELGADIHTKNRNGTNLLMYALSYFQKTRDSKVFNLLLKAGAPPEGVDNRGKDLRHYIVHNECSELLNLLP